MIKRRLILLVLWIASIVLISFYGGPLSYGLFWLLTLAPISSILYLVIVVMGFRIDQRIKSRTVVSGQLNDYYLELKNDSIFAYSGLKFHMFEDFFKLEKVPEDATYQLNPKENVRFETRIVCKYRGTYDVGVDYVVIYDYLNLFKWKYKIISPVKAIVKPKVYQLDRLRSIDSITTDGNSETTTGSSFPDAAIREYVPGDSIRTIHWKATARTGELKVRRYIDESSKGIAIYYDGARYSTNPKEFIPLENKILEVTLSVANFFARKQVGAWITQGGSDVINALELSDINSFEAFYETVSDTSFLNMVNDEAGQAEFLDRCMALKPQVAIMVVHKLGEETINKTGELGAMGTFVVIYVVDNSAKDSYGSLDNDYRKIIVLDVEEKLEQIL